MVLKQKNSYAQKNLLPDEKTKIQSVRKKILNFLLSNHINTGHHQPSEFKADTAINSRQLPSNLKKKT